MNIAINILMGINAVLCVLMILIILMQRSKNEGMGAAFGGSMMDATFGADTTNVLTKATTWFAIFFFVLTLTLSILFTYRNSASEVAKKLKEASALSSVPTNAPVPVVPADAGAQAQETLLPAGTGGTNQPASQMPPAP